MPISALTWTWVERSEWVTAGSRDLAAGVSRVLPCRPSFRLRSLHMRQAFVPEGGRAARQTLRARCARP
jgi:hypothetical protein